MQSIAFYPEDALGPIRPLSGVGGGPVSGNFAYDAREDFREALPVGAVAQAYFMDDSCPFK